MKKPFKGKEDGKPFVKNDPRINKKGRPKKLPELDVLLADILGEEKDGKTAAEAILKAIRLKAAKGDIRAAEMIFDRAYGKAKQSIEFEDKTVIRVTSKKKNGG